ncbi:MAG: class I SAM-dependent methyltransferase, partial [Aristaeellaceae bacterium]
VLDLGCGWGAIGVALARGNPEARITMADVNRRALSLAEENARRNGVTVRCVESDGMSALMDGRYHAVVTNPPIRAGKQVIYRMFADAARVLEPEGALYLVIRKQQGAESCMKYLKTLYGSVEKLDKSAGFWVLRASEPREEDTSDEV